MPTPTRFTVAAVSTVPFPSLTLTADAEAVRDAAALLGKSVEVTDPVAELTARDERPNGRREVTERALSLLERFGFERATLSVVHDYAREGFGASCDVPNGDEFRAAFVGRSAAVRSHGHGWATATVTVDGVEFRAGWPHRQMKFELADWIVGTPLPTEEPVAPTEAPADTAPVAAEDVVGDDVDVVF